MEVSAPKQVAEVPALAVNGGLAAVKQEQGAGSDARPQSSPTPASLDLTSRHSSAGSSSRQMHKCRSLPRIPANQSPMTVPLGYPRIHVGGNMLSTSDLMLDTDQLSIAGNVGLLRSMSARTVDSLVHLDRSLASSNSGSRFLSPCGDMKTDNLAARSTSCPSMAYPMLTCRTSSHFQFRHGVDDVNLDGEEITDLPIEPTQNFPDLIPELREDYTPDSTNGNLPLYADICDGDSSEDKPPPEGAKRENNNDKKEPQEPAAEGPRSKDGVSDRQRMDGNFNVSSREKCIRWLKSLSIDKS